MTQNVRLSWQRQLFRASPKNAFPTDKKPSIFTGKARHRQLISGLPQEHEGMSSRALADLASVIEHVGLIQTRFLAAATVPCDLGKVHLK